MKIGCCAWNHHYPPPYEEAVKAIGEAGFQGVGLICLTPKVREEYYTRKRIKNFIELYESYGMELIEFVVRTRDITDRTVGHINSLNPEDKKAGIETFRKGAQLAKELGTKLINTITHKVHGYGFGAPMGHYIHPFSLGSYPGDDMKYLQMKWHIDLPKNFVWKKYWDSYADAINQCADIAAENGLIYVLENHDNAILSGTDSYLMMIDDVDSEAWGFCMDTGWTFEQREYLPQSVYKIGQRGRLFNLHIRDGDGYLSYNIPAGLGVLDWNHIVKALKDVGYKGFLEVELSGYRDWIGASKTALNYLKPILKEQGVLDK